MVGAGGQLLPDVAALGEADAIHESQVGLEGQGHSWGQVMDPLWNACGVGGKELPEGSGVYQGWGWPLPSPPPGLAFRALSSGTGRGVGGGRASAGGDDPSPRTSQGTDPPHSESPPLPAPHHGPVPRPYRAGTGAGDSPGGLPAGRRAPGPGPRPG